MIKVERLELGSLDVVKRISGKNEGIGINIAIPDANLSAKGVLTTTFFYTVNYLPDRGTIKIGGTALFSGDDAKAAYSEWKKSGQMAGPAGEQILNIINYNCALNSVFPAKIFDLEPPIAPPTIKIMPKK